MVIPFNTLAWLHGKDYRAPETKQEKFRHQLIWGRTYEPLVAAYLVNHGIVVSMAAATDIEKRSVREQVPDFTGNGYRIECKSSKLHSLPKMVEVDSIRSWERKKLKPDFYVMISKRTWRMVWTRGNDCHDWVRGRAHSKPYFLAPRELFHPIEDLVDLLKS